MRRAREGSGSVAYAAGMVAVVAVVAALLKLPGRDVRFCQRVLTGLAAGSVSVRQAIAWERLRAMDVDVGASYNQLADPAERAAYQRAFIQSFAEGFRQSGAAPGAFTNWRKASQRSVIAEYPAKQRTVVFQVVGLMRLQLAGIQWQ